MAAGPIHSPKVKKILLRILPYELLIVTNSILLWTLIGGLLGKYTFIGVCLSFCTIYAALHIKQKRDARKPDTIEDSLAEEEFDIPEEEGPAEQEVEDDFKFVSALTSIWLPSVVGCAKSNFFLITSIVSLANKLILLTVAVLLVFFTDIDTKPLLLWCQPNITKPSTFQR